MTPTAYSDTVGHNFEISKKEERRMEEQKGRGKGNEDTGAGNG